MARLSPAATIASRGKAVVGEVRVRDQLTDELLSSFSQPISNQTQIPQPSPAATRRQPQRCTRSIPYCQRTIHDARPWPASFRLPMLQANLSHLRLDDTLTSWQLVSFASNPVGPTMMWI